MQPALAQVSTLAAAFDVDVADYAAAGCEAIELWLTKLEDYVEANSVAAARELFSANRLAAPVASFQGGLFEAETAARGQHWDLYRKRLGLCEQLDVKTLVVALDLARPSSSDSLRDYVERLSAAGKLAAEHRVRLACEFQADRGFANNLQTAAALVGEVGMANVGLCVDLFHLHTGPSSESDLALLTNENLFHVQLSDLVGTLRELAVDADRILPGDGEIALAPLVARLREIDYGGCVSVELLNPHVWQIPPRQFADVALTALRTALGLAGDG
ncbi:MAG: sugar phosphate isomerase/epimerase family protein [Pirellulales bacterium]